MQNTNKRKNIIAGAIVASLLVFWAIWTVVVLTGGLYGFERSFYSLLVGEGGNRYYSYRWYLARAVSFGGNVAVLLWVYLLLVIIPKTRHRLGLKLLVAGLLAPALNTIIKNIFRRPRPDWTYGDFSGFGLSYPSGHAFSVATVATVLILFLLTEVKNKKISVPLIAVCAFMPLVIGFSRVFLGVHYVTDSIAGFSLGIVLGISVFMIFPVVWGKVGAWLAKYPKIRVVHRFLFGQPAAARETE